MTPNLTASIRTLKPLFHTRKVYRNLTDRFLKTRSLERLKVENESLADSAMRHNQIILYNLPVHLTIFNTTACNQRCFHCSKTIDMLDDKEMPSDLIEKLAIELFPTLRIMNLTVMGEPLLSKGIDKLLNLLNTYSVGLEIFTNGMLLKGDSFIRKLFSNLVSLNVSIDAATKETYSKIRSGGDFNQVIRNLRSFDKIRRDLGDKINCAVRFNYTLMRRNIEEFPRFIELANELGADVVNASHIVIFREDLKNESLIFHKNLANENIKKAQEIAHSLGIILMSPPPYSDVFSGLHTLVNEASKGCSFLWKNAFVNWDGEVLPCCGTIGVSVGNVRKVSFKDVWNGPAYKEMRKRLVTRNPLHCCLDCHLINQKVNPANKKAFLKFAISQSARTSIGSGHSYTSIFS